MNDKSFQKFGGLAGILLALTSWTTVAVYFLFVPLAQRVPITDPKAFLESLAQNSAPTFKITRLSECAKLSGIGISR